VTHRDPHDATRSHAACHAPTRANASIRGDPRAAALPRFVTALRFATRPLHELRCNGPAIAATISAFCPRSALAVAARKADAERVSAPLIDASQAAWLQGPVSILIATAGVDGAPGLGVGLGVRIADDRRRLAVFVLDTVNRQVLDDVRAGRALAVAFTHSASTRALQLKAAHATIAPLAPEDPARLDAYAAALAREWARHGEGEAFAHAYLVRAPGTIVAIELVPEAAFEQSPGPHAGSVLGAGT